MQIAVVQFGDTDETAALQAYRITRGAWAATVPDIPYITADSFVAAVRRPAPSHGYERALAYLNGVPAGCVEVQLPVKDNRENAGIEMWVAPAHRRQGVGRALYEHAADRVRELGRKRLTGETVQSVPGGSEFCAALGATPALPETRSRLDVGMIDRLDELLAESWTHAAGYRLVLWQGVPPAQYIDHVADLDSRFFSDAPLGALNASSNEHMLAINRTMGFRAVDSWMQWQLTV